jgi:hypothetical protein
MVAVNQEKAIGEYMLTLTGLTWCVVCIVFLFFITFSCHATIEEYKKSQILIEKLALRTGLGHETLSELRVLSAQLNNMKVAFTAGGSFSLDLGFMYSFVGVICTYLLILAQFD